MSATNDMIIAEATQQAKGQVPKVDLSSPPGSIINLRYDYDQQLLVDFYQKYMIPNFPIQSELEPLENFLTGLKNNPNFPSADPSRPETEFDLILILDGPIPKREKGKKRVYPPIMGGMIFEYYPSVNIGLITYILVGKSYRGRGLSQYEIHKAVQVLDTNAKNNGHLSGCDCIFLETNSARKISAQQDVLAPRRRHRILHRNGCRLVDFDYISPPLGPSFPKCDFLLLTVVLTERIPKDGSNYYIPSVLVERFIRAYWASANSLKNETGAELEFENDPDYIKMLEQIHSREKMPLLDLPWGGGREWTVIDLADDYDLDLLVKFYREFMMESFDCEPLENIIRYLSPDSSSSPSLFEFHLLIALDMTTSPPEFMGGVGCEYHMIPNCGLVTYLFVRKEARQRGLGRLLMNDLQSKLHQCAIQHGHLAGLNLTFYEVVLKGGEEKAHEFLSKRSICQVAFDYQAPPYSPLDYSKPYLLAVHMSDKLPSEVDANGKRTHYVPVKLFKNFIKHTWKEAEERGYIKSFQEDRNFKYQMRQLENLEKIPVLTDQKPPWHRVVPPNAQIPKL